MQKLHLIYIVVLYLFSPVCTGQYIQSDSILQNATKADFIKAQKKYKNQLVNDTILYRKVNGEIKLPIKNKSAPYIIYKDNPAEEESMQEYIYLGKFEDLGLYVVQGYFWEATSTYIIDRKTGNTETIWNTPALSPDGKYIANLSGMYGFEDVPEGFQVWKVNKKGSPKPIAMVVEVIQEKWIPVDFVWENENTLLIKTTTPDNYLKNNGNPTDKDCYYLRYTL